MADIVLTTFNARYTHTALGLRCLLANLGELSAQAVIHEFLISQRPLDAVEAILAENPRVVGVGVYIWNVAACVELLSLLRAVRPEVVLVVGGPEVSYEIDGHPVAELADFVIAGEGELAFAQLCRALQSGSRPAQRIWRVEPPALADVALPYRLYTDEDIAHRVVYVEATRGCPFGCEFCLSSLDPHVRRFDSVLFLSEMETLYARGVRAFKFLDRTFNLSIPLATELLQFFLARAEDGLFVHLEMVPERLPDALVALLGQFPPGSVQLEVGIQTFDPEVAARIGRRQDVGRIEANLQRLRAETGVHVHADLIAGLPGESLAGFGRGFDRLVALRPQEIQVGVLKRLRGTAIARHAADFDMVFAPRAPYEVLRTRDLSFADVQRLRRFSRYWDMVGNSGNFAITAPLLWGSGSPFEGFLAFSDWLFARTGASCGIALRRLADLVLEYLVHARGLVAGEVAPLLAEDYGRAGRRGLPAGVAELVEDTGTGDARRGGDAQGRKTDIRRPARRQDRHLAAGRDESS